MDVTSLFYRHFEGRNSLKTALIYLRADGTEEKYSWVEEYHFRAICIAEWLRRKSVKKGDFVAIIPLNLPDSFFVMLGIILIGAVPVPINIQLLKETGLVDLRKIIDDCKPKLVLASKLLGTFMSGIDHYSIEETINKSAMLFLALPGFGRPLTYYSRFYPTAKDDDLLIMPYTSGTSGQPKGVMLTHKNILNRLVAVASALGVTSEERILSYLPLGHIAELITTFFGQIYCGYTVYFTEYAKEVISNSEKYGRNFPAVLQQVRPTIFIAVPRIWTSFRKKIEAQIKNSPVPQWLLPRWLKKQIIKKKLGFGQTRVFISAAAQFSDDDLVFFADLGIPISDVYGQTETAGPLTLNSWPLGAETEIRVENGEIVVSGDCVMSGYYKNPSATASVFFNNSRGGVIYHTGDTGVQRGSRILWTGRIGDGFKNDKGEYYHPDKIGQLEEKIKKINPKISEVVVCGINRPYLIALIFSESYLDKNLQEKIRHELPKRGEGMYKVRGFALINSAGLELTPTMKVKRNVMLEKCASIIDFLYK